MNEYEKAKKSLAEIGAKIDKLERERESLEDWLEDHKTFEEWGNCGRLILKGEKAKYFYEGEAIFNYEQTKARSYRPFKKRYSGKFYGSDWDNYELDYFGAEGTFW